MEHGTVVARAYSYSRAHGDLWSSSSLFSAIGVPSFRISLEMIENESEPQKFSRGLRAAAPNAVAERRTPATRRGAAPPRRAPPRHN